MSPPGKFSRVEVFLVLFLSCALTFVMVAILPPSSLHPQPPVLIDEELPLQQIDNVQEKPSLDGSTCPLRERAEYQGVNRKRLDICNAFTSPSLGGVRLRAREKPSKYDKYHATGSFSGYWMHDPEKLMYYLMIPKGGSTTLRYALATYTKFGWHQGCHCNKHYAIEPRRMRPILRSNSTFTFSYVTDPVSHVLGGWLQACRGHHCDGEGFKYYIEALANGGGWDGGGGMSNEHHRTQLQFFQMGQDGKGPTTMDFVGRLTREYAQNDWEALQALLLAKKNVNPFPKEMPRQREGNTGAYNARRDGAREMLKNNPDQVRRVCAVRWAEFRCFGFEFPKECLDSNGLFDVTEFGRVSLISQIDPPHGYKSEYKTANFPSTPYDNLDDENVEEEGAPENDGN